MLAIATKIRAAPRRRAKGLLVMREKLAGETLLQSFEVIILIKADFDCYNRLLLDESTRNFIPEEIHNKKGGRHHKCYSSASTLYKITRQLQR